jgi:hypothetical protein
MKLPLRILRAAIGLGLEANLAGTSTKLVASIAESIRRGALAPYVKGG